MTPNSEPRARTPWHLWLVAILTLLWNGSGAFTVMMAQAGRLPNMDANEAAYYAALPLWFVITTAVALLAPIAGAVALLFRSRTAPMLFAISVTALLANNLCDLAAGTSLTLIDRGWLVLTIVSIVIAVLQLIYSSKMKKRGVLG